MRDPKNNACARGARQQKVTSGPQHEEDRGSCLYLDSRRDETEALFSLARAAHTQLGVFLVTVLVMDENGITGFLGNNARIEGTATFPVTTDV